MSTIVDWFETNKPSGEPLVLTEPSKVWVDRLWHIAIRMPTDADAGERDLDEMEAAFEKYLNGLADQQERDLTRAAWLMLLTVLEEGWDSLPRCEGCGAFLCPHCGHKYASSHDEEAER